MEIENNAGNIFEIQEIRNFQNIPAPIQHLEETTSENEEIVTVNR